MSYDLMVFDKRNRFRNKDDFFTWYKKLVQWSDNIDYNDYRHSTCELQRFFLEMKDIVPPLNGEFSPSDEELGQGEYQEADYCIARDAIYMAFSWSDGHLIHPIVKEKAREHDVAFFDITSERVLYPDGFILDLNKPEKISLWQRIKSFLSGS